MRPAVSISPPLTAAILLFSILGRPFASTITTVSPSVPTSISTQTCEFRTINYITDTLPQRCLRSTWSHPNGTMSTTTEAVESTGIATNLDTATSMAETEADQGSKTTQAVADPSATSATPTSSSSTDTPEASQTEQESEELNDPAFLSFEEWRKQTLAKAGQENTNIGGKKSKDGKRKDSEGIQNHLDSLGDEGEIDLDFGAFKTGRGGDEATAEPNDGEDERRQEEDEHGVRKKKEKDQYRSKDAGKTCKERLSYASFDAGAIILKTHQGAKNPRSILIENKDSYMLSECRTENKFVIIELSEDIWIDTVVLANYEFFSSMVRSFRVSVSDRYPVKMEKWKDAGTYEARNSREIQAFLIENPQIWARYLRIEFLTHYGKEFYCPLSLVRVHGTRMLESWKESEANNDDEDDGDGNDDTSSEEQFVPEAVADAVVEEEKLQAELREAQAAIENLVKEAQEISATFTELPLNVSQLVEVNTSLEQAVEEQLFTPWVADFDFGAWMNISNGLDMCLPKESPFQTVLTTTSGSNTITSTTSPSAEPTSSSDIGVANSTSAIATATQLNKSTSSPSAAATTTDTGSTTASTRPESNSVSHSPETTTAAISKINTPAAKLQNSTSSTKSKISSTSSAISALPTQQESFFKAVSRRLQLLEANSTLSLKYIEDQSRALRDAFARVEKKQLNKATTFLDTLNSTVLAELKEIRQQYDEIWQSTVISLESQREENKKEILAISSRLNILADEVVFQKRMSIIQSVLLLLCLGLVIFSRMSPSSSLEFSNRSRYFNSFPLESPVISPPGSPEYDQPLEDLEESQHEWAARYRREQSGDSSVTLEYDEEAEEDYYNHEIVDEAHETPISPPTPTSLYSRSPSYTGTPPLRAATSTPDSFYRSSPLKRSVSAQYSTSSPQHATGNFQGNQNGHPSVPARLSSFKDGKSVEASRSRARAKSDPRHNPALGNHEASPSPVRTPRKRKSIKKQQQQQQVGPPPDDNPVTPTSNGQNGIGVHFSPPDASHTSHASAENGQVPIINTTPASPLQTQRNGANGSRRDRHTSNGSFSIARKPLPALPQDKQDDDDA